MTLRYGIIGSGMMGGEHIRNIALLPNAQVTAIVDPDETMRRQAAALAGGEARGFNSLADCLSTDICDAYVIAAPNDLHHALLLDMLPGNKPILCEKPLCTTSADCRDIINLAKNRTAPVWVAMEYRYMPPVQRLMQEVAAGTAGDLKMLAIREHRFPFLPKVGDWNRFNARTGGTLTEKCCHFWDLMRLILKADPVRVYASAAMDVNHTEEVYEGRTPDIIDNAFVTVDFANGTRGMLDLCMFAEGSYWQEVVSVTGPRARIDACIPGPARFSTDGAERLSQVVVSERATKLVTTHDIHIDHTILSAGDHHGSTYFQHQAFAKLVQTGKGEPEVTLEDGLWSVIVGEAAELSAREKRVVEL